MGQSLWIRSLSAGAGIAAIAAAAPSAAMAAAHAHRFHYDHVLGTSLDVVAVGGEGEALVAVAAARAEIARLDRILSGWREDSELSALNRQTPAGDAIPVSAELFDVVAAAERWRGATDGTFDARRGDPAAGDVVLDHSARSVARPDGLRFDLDAVAKGWIVDAALAAARRAAPLLAGLMVDIGGDVRCWGRAPGGDCWRIGVAAPGRMDETAPPAAVLGVSDKAVASSGSAARGGHILSPATGRAPEGFHAATVVADSAADADALATAFTLLAPARSLEIAAGLPGVEAMIVAADGQTWLTDGWSALDGKDADAALVRSSDGAASWPEGAALTVGYQIPKFDVENYRAPYVAIWVTDEKRKLVRTLLLLGNEERWLDSNYVWWRRYGRKMDGLDTMTKPSRQPGTYSAVWDGTTDDGGPAGPGTYLVHVEAAREHGDHTYQSAELTIGGTPVDVTIPAKGELGELTVRFGQTP